MTAVRPCRAKPRRRRHRRHRNRTARYATERGRQPFSLTPRRRVPDSLADCPGGARSGRARCAGILMGRRRSGRAGKNGSCGNGKNRMPGLRMCVRPGEASGASKRTREREKEIDRQTDRRTELVQGSGRLRGSSGGSGVRPADCPIAGVKRESVSFLIFHSSRSSRSLSLSFARPLVRSLWSWTLFRLNLPTLSWPCPLALFPFVPTFVPFIVALFAPARRETRETARRMK